MHFLTMLALYSFLSILIVKRIFFIGDGPSESRNFGDSVKLNLKILTAK